MKSLLTSLSKNLQWIIIIGVVIVGTSYIQDGFAQTELDDYIEQVEQFAVVVDGMLDYTDSLRSHVAELEEENIELQQRDTILVAQIDSLIDEIVAVQPILDSLQSVVDTISDIPEPVQQYIDGLEDQNVTLKEDLSASARLIDNLRSQVELVTAQRDIHATRADSLGAVIQTFPSDVPDSEHILFGLIPLPSRTTSFFTGAAIATAASFIIIR